MIRLEKKTKREARHSKMLEKEIEDLRKVVLSSPRAKKPWNEPNANKEPLKMIVTTTICNQDIMKQPKG